MALIVSEGGVALRSDVRFRPKLWPRARSERHVALKELQDECPLELPEAYLRLLWRRNGDSGALPVAPWRYVLWPAREVLALNQHFDVDHNYPGLFGFGGDGGPLLLALDGRGGAPFAVVCVPYVGLAAEIETIAPDFEAFLELAGLRS